MNSFRVSANNLTELFQIAASQFLSVHYSVADVGQTLREKLVLQAPNVSELLQQWFLGIHQLIQQEHFLPSQITIIQVSDTELQAYLEGEPFDPLSHRLKPFSGDIAKWQIQQTPHSTDFIFDIITQ